MVKTEFLTNQFLIAMPNLMDPNFFHSVTYICEHNEKGAMGIVINQPVNLTLSELAHQMQLTCIDSIQMEQPVFRGGPVETERGFVLHQPMGQWQSTLNITDQLGISTSTDIIAALAVGDGPAQCLVALGYAGWGAGQLEREMVANTWLSGPADTHVIFNTDTEHRWEAAANLLGVNIHHISGDAGHA
ncbi:MAG: YqgE/AlgH family protein [Gammaproteobacteria bacterium]|nr:YqgE/AlgH family protein [Gammaproteobacteria bacterium]